jgi:hypothetical protein
MRTISSGVAAQCAPIGSSGASRGAQFVLFGEWQPGDVGQAADGVRRAEPRLAEFVTIEAGPIEQASDLPPIRRVVGRRLVFPGRSLDVRLDQAHAFGVPASGPT